MTEPMAARIHDRSYLVRYLEKDESVLGTDSIRLIAHAANSIRVAVAGSENGLRTLSITNRLRKALIEVFGEAFEGTLFAQLSTRKSWPLAIIDRMIVAKELYLVGDMLHAFPWRFIDTSMKGKFIPVVGGLGNELLSEELNCRVFCFGLTQFVEREALSEQYKTDTRYWEHVDSWVGRPKSSLSDWSTLKLSSIWSEAAYDSLPIGASGLEIFDSRRGSGRWSQIEKITDAPNGILLCKYATEGSARKRYCLALLAKRGQSLGIARSLELNVSEGLRLQFALASSSRRNVVRAIRHDHSFELRGLMRLPTPESRIMALALPDESGGNGSHFSTAFFDVVVAVLKSLDVEVEEHHLAK
jgi:hypothetical protein